MPIVIIVAAFIGTAVATVAYLPTYGIISGFGYAILTGNAFATLACLWIVLKNEG